MSGIAICGLCEWEGPIELIFSHLEAVHGFWEPPATWPDGELVVVDRTLEPSDFLEEENE